MKFFKCFFPTGTIKLSLWFPASNQLWMNKKKRKGVCRMSNFNPPSNFSFFSLPSLQRVWIVAYVTWYCYYRLCHLWKFINYDYDVVLFAGCNILSILLSIHNVFIPLTLFLFVNDTAEIKSSGEKYELIVTLLFVYLKDYH